MSMEKFILGVEMILVSVEFLLIGVVVLQMIHLQIFITSLVEVWV